MREKVTGSSSGSTGVIRSQNRVEADDIYSYGIVSPHETGSTWGSTGVIRAPRSGDAAEGGRPDNSGSSRPDDALVPKINRRDSFATSPGCAEKGIETCQTERPEQIMACLMSVIRENVSFSVEDWVLAQKDDGFCKMVLKRLQEAEITPYIWLNRRKEGNSHKKRKKSRTRK
jgi:hypothetical protein